jgi:hypothetical protein
MKKALAVLAVANGLLVTQAAIFDLDIEPNGLQGLSERPNPIGTTASGGEVASQPSMSLNNTTHQLNLNYAWGAANGFSDLESDFLLTHIHGPADVNNFTGVLYDLMSFKAPPGSGLGAGGRAGTVFGTLQLVADPKGSPYSIAQQEADLLNGLWYVNVHSVDHTGGEIRGQLVPVPEPQTYAMIAGFGLLGFAAYRRFKTQTV